jgi:hypothetical protein
LKKLQDEIEAGKNLVNMSVSSSIALKDSEIPEKHVPNPFKTTLPERPVLEETDILKQINESLDWEHLENNEPSFYGLQMKSPT